MLDGFEDVSVMLRCGVYLLCHRGTVVYVGKSKVILGRVYTHRVAWGRKSRKPQTAAIPARGILFDQILVRACASHEVDDLEAKLIAELSPRYNTQLKTSIPPELSDLVARITASRGSLPRPPESALDRRGF
jgi:excinuclease UvrABC nuclease subunit